MPNGTLGLSNRKIVNRKSSISDSGYMLITLMLFVALLAIASLAVLPAIKQQIKRDREEELQHRGTAYMRAIQHFYKKTGRYPARIEELENTNNIRFLRKRYKDPMSRDPETHQEKDFKLLHMQDINLFTGQAGGPGLLGGPGLGGPGLGGPGLGGPGLGGPALGGPPAGLPGGVPQGGLTKPVAGNSPPGADTADTGDAANNDTGANPPASNQNSPNRLGGGPLQSNPASGNNPLVFGGGPILGVASTSKDQSIREFGDKYKHYNEWLFVYDPTADRGGLLKGPVVPGQNKGPGIGMSAQSMANQSRGAAGGIQPQPPTQQPQGPQNPQMPPDEEP